MNKQPSTIILSAVLGLALLTLSCQSLPGFEIFGGEEVSAAGQPRSHFVPPQQTIQVRVGQPLPLESYHISRNKLSSIKIFINGQPLRTEETAGQSPFPMELAQAQVLVRDQPPEANLQALTFPSFTCRNLIDKGGPVQRNSLDLEFPSSNWTVCHIWIGRVPGTYDLSLVATDRAGQEGEPIVQRIEVK